MAAKENLLGVLFRHQIPSKAFVAVSCEQSPVCVLMLGFSLAMDTNCKLRQCTLLWHLGLSHSVLLTRKGSLDAPGNARVPPTPTPFSSRFLQVNCWNHNQLQHGSQGELYTALNPMLWIRHGLWCIKVYLWLSYKTTAPHNQFLERR